MKTSYEIFLEPRAAKELDKAPKEIFKSLDKAILELTKNPRPFGVKKLDEHLFRIRVGHWRIIFSIFEKERKVSILRVVRRNEKTYRNF